jgi:putative heme-binding domain-containing protein
MRFAFVFVLVTGLAPAQQQPPHLARAGGQTLEESYMGDPKAVAMGQELFSAACSACHGANGEGGRGPSLLTGRATRMKGKELHDVVQDGVPGSDMPPFPLPDEQLWHLAAYVASLSAPAFSRQVPGDPKSGEQLFFGKAGCANCHSVLGRGGALGPDLSNAGLLHYMYRLREGVLEPNKRIAEGYDPVRVTLQSGKIIEGVARNYTNYSFHVLDKGGKLHLLPAADVREVVFLKDTWMPRDYAGRLTSAEIDDVLAYMSRQATRELLPPDKRERRGRE